MTFVRVVVLLKQLAPLAVIYTPRHDVLVTDVAPIIIQIFEWYATGQCSIAEITERVRQAGLVSRGARKPISKSNINNVLRKRIYTGDFDWNGKTYRGSHQPLISTEVFDRVHEILDGRYTSKQKVAKHELHSRAWSAADIVVVRS